MKFSLLNICCATLLGIGCASTNVNPPAPRAGSAYLDFYAGAEPGLAWKIQRREGSTDQFKTVFSDLNPIPDGILRIALPPGRHQLRVTVLNRVINEPALLDVDAAGDAR
jgi:hypothetical protein